MLIYIEGSNNGKDIFEIGFNHDWLPTHAQIKKILKHFQKLEAKYSDAEIKLMNIEAEERLYASMKVPQKPRKVDPIRGFIYVLKSANLYKIGRSGNPKDRFKTYSTENPHGVVIVLLQEVEDCVVVEKEVQDAFLPKRVRGEWYALESQDIDKIKSILATK